MTLYGCEICDNYIWEYYYLYGWKIYDNCIWECNTLLEKTEQNNRVLKLEYKLILNEWLERRILSSLQVHKKLGAERFTKHQNNVTLFKKIWVRSWVNKFNDIVIQLQV